MAADSKGLGDRIADWAETQFGFARNIALIGVVLFGVSHRRTRDTMEAAAAELIDGGFELRDDIRRAAQNFRDGVWMVFITTFVLFPAIFTGIAMFVEGWERKAVLILPLAAWWVFIVIRNSAFHAVDVLVASIGAAAIVTIDRLRAFLKYGSRVEQDMGSQTDGAAVKALLPEFKGIRNEVGDTFMGGVELVLNWLRFSFQFPLAIVAWCLVGSAVYVFADFYHHRGAAAAGLLMVLIIITFLTGYSRKKAEDGTVIERPTQVRIPLALAGLAIAALVILTWVPAIKSFVDAFLNDTGIFKGDALRKVFWAVSRVEVVLTGLFIGYKLGIARLVTEKWKAVDRAFTLIMLAAAVLPALRLVSPIVLGNAVAIWILLIVAVCALLFGLREGKNRHYKAAGALIALAICLVVLVMPSPAGSGKGQGSGQVGVNLPPIPGLPRNDRHYPPDPGTAYPHIIQDVAYGLQPVRYQGRNYSLVPGTKIEVWGWANDRSLDPKLYVRLSGGTEVSIAPDQTRIFVVNYEGVPQVGCRVPGARGEFHLRVSPYEAVAVK